jgi:hypothetical protein
VDGRIILKWIFKENGLMWHRIQSACSCERGDGRSGSIKYRELLD